MQRLLFQRGDTNYCCPECLPLRELRDAISDASFDLLDAFVPKGKWAKERHCRIEGQAPLMKKLSSEIAAYRKKLALDGRVLSDELNHMYRHNKEELRENPGDPFCRVYHLTFSALMYAKFLALLKKGYGDGRLSLKSLGKAFEEAKGKIKIYGYAEYEGGRTKEILLPFEGIVERMKGCEGLYEGGLSLLKQDAKLNLEFLDHNSYCHKGKSDEISFRSFRRALTLLEYCYRAFAFLFDPEGWESFVYSTEEEEDEFDRKLDEEYHSKFRVNVRYVCSGRGLHEA